MCFIIIMWAAISLSFLLINTVFSLRGTFSFSDYHFLSYITQQSHIFPPLFIKLAHFSSNYFWITLSTSIYHALELVFVFFFLISVLYVGRQGKRAMHSVIFRRFFSISL